MTPNFEIALNEIKTKLLAEIKNPDKKSKLKFSLTDPKNVEYRKKYIGTNYEFYALSTPQEKSVVKKGFQFAQALSFGERVDLWTRIWSESKNYHVMSQAIQALGELIQEIETPQKHLYFLKALQKWLPALDNWAHSDGVSSLLAQLLELSLKDKKLLAEHLRLRKKWNQSKNSWERRQSLVSLLYYAGSREKYLPYKQMILFVEPLLKDEAFYVQRGVGWTLRELYNVSPKETFAFLKKNIKLLSSIAFSASTEKLKPAAKASLLKMRRK